MLAIFILHWHHFAVSYLRRVKVSPLLYVTICSSLFLKYVFIISTVFCKFHYHLSVCISLLKTSLKPCLLVTCVPFTYMPIKVCSNHQSHSPWGHPEVPLLQLTPELTLSSDCQPVVWLKTLDIPPSISTFKVMMLTLLTSTTQFTYSSFKLQVSSSPSNKPALCLYWS